MKNFVTALLCILLCVSCDKKTEAHPQESSDYATKPVGEDRNGTLHTADMKAVAYKWGEAVGKELKGFKIVKTLTKGKESKECYLLTAQTKDGKSSVGGLLKVESGKFFLDVKTVGSQSFTQIVICKNSCADGLCEPLVVLRGDEMTPICGECNECEKIITEVYLSK